MIYLDTAATTFTKPKEVLKSVIHAMQNNSANAGRGGHSAAMQANEILLQAKENLACLFHVENPEQIVFCYNTTHALNTAIKGVLSYGDHVIFTSMEHNSVVRPIMALKEQKRITYSVLHGNADGTVDVSKLEKLIKPQTKLICMTHSSNVCGTILDIEAAASIAKKRGVLFLADAAQSAGVLDLNCNLFDLVAFPGHKGIMGPMGTGGLYVRQGLSLMPLTEGGTGSLSESPYQPEFMPDRLESGTQNVPAIAGLSAAVEFLLKIGIDTVKSHENTLCRYFEERVRAIPNVTVYGNQHKTAVCALNIDGVDSTEVARRLNDTYDIAVRAGLHCAYSAHKTLGTEKIGCVRFSFGFFNTLQEVERAVNAVYDLAKEVYLK